jgi:hypothetical protein
MAHDIRQMINNTLYDEGRFRRVISDDVLNNLRIIKYSKDTCKNENCPILYVDFTEDDDVIKLECGHCFDPESIKKWLKEHKAECPVCRYKLESIEVRVNNIDEQHNSNTNFRRFQEVEELFASLYRSYNILNHTNLNNHIYIHSNQPSQSSLATLGAGAGSGDAVEDAVEDLVDSIIHDNFHTPLIQRILRYDVDFYDFIETYQELFELEN